MADCIKSARFSTGMQLIHSCIGVVGHLGFDNTMPGHIAVDLFAGAGWTELRLSAGGLRYPRCCRVRSYPLRRPRVQLSELRKYLSQRHRNRRRLHQIKF
jgi:hypothetical protein